ncbi:MAG: ABC transporter ATP-binding protein [Hyphomicrobiales bacterium]
MTITLANINSGYDGFTLKNINLIIEQGKFTALIGPNGCGKSTLLKTIGRIIKVKSGSVKIGDLDVLRERPKKVAQTIAYLPQNPEIPSAINVEQLVSYGRAPYQSVLGIKSTRDVELVDEAIHLASINESRKNNVAELSGGQRQRAFIAMALAQDTPYIMLDEPTTFLDIKYQYEVLDLIKKLTARGHTCIVVLHDIAQAARYADDIVVMREGEIYAQGSPKEIVTQKMIQNVYDLDCLIHSDPITNTPIISPKLSNGIF